MFSTVYDARLKGLLLRAIGVCMCLSKFQSLDACKHCAMFMNVTSSLYSLTFSPRPCCQASGIDVARLASYDRAIREEPSFKPEQVEGLTRDLTAYLTTLKVSRHISAVRTHREHPLSAGHARLLCPSYC